MGRIFASEAMFFSTWTHRGPPGHGDLYPAMLGSGALDKLLAQAARRQGGRVPPEGW